MQTFNIDISRKNGPLVLYAKQGDSLSRFFKIIFFQDGAPWEPPAGALFSVRFGAPGMPDGWYDTIKEPDGSTHSAFSLKDNALTVELAYEAVSKAGTNTLAVLVLDANGYQLGAWNLRLDVELTPGENSPEVDVYYSLLSEQVAQVLQAKDDAQASAILSQSWAVGGTGTRTGEDTNNSKYWSDEAKKSAQESLGFRTFFSAVRPDLNGDLDPSSPMFAGTGASVTVRSAANRIENVTSHGYTEQAGSGDASPTNVRPITVGGLKLVKKVLTGDENWKMWWSTPGFYYIQLETSAINAESQVNVYGEIYKGQTRSKLRELSPIYDKQCAASAGELVICDMSCSTVDDFKNKIKTKNLSVWYVPADESQATGLYTPQISDGESYHCNCIELQQHLCDGDTVDSNVPSGCDKSVVFDGSEDEGWELSGSGANQFLFLRNALPGNSKTAVDALSNLYPNTGVYSGNTVEGFSGYDASLYVRDSRYKTAEDFKAALAANPLIIYYRSTEYTAKNDEKACVERHVQALMVLDGTENFVLDSTGRLDLPNGLPHKPKNTSCICSVAKPKYEYAGSGVFVQPTNNGLYFGSKYSKNNGFETADEWKQYLATQYAAGTPVTIVYDIATPITYAQPAVDLPADPITSTTQAILPEFPTPDTMIPLAEKGEIGTYTVIGEKTVSVYLKPMQDGGDAATLGGKTLLEITQPLTLQLNGITNQTYDGSTAKTFNVTPTAIGALPADQPAVSAPKSSKPTFAVNYGRIVSPDNSSLYLRNADSEGSGVFIGVREGFQTLSPDMNTSGTPVNLGGPSYRWRTLYLQNQPDVSSDGNLKEKVAPLSEKQMLFFDSLNPVQYKLKGDYHDRLHYGFIAQEVEQAMAAAGISDMEFGGFCKDRKIRVVQQYSESGKLLSETIEQLDGYEYSLRYGEFIALNTAAIQAMKKEISDLKAEINKLKGV